IQFSNNLCYSAAPLVPLKQYGAGRLAPTVQVVPIRESYQEGTASRAINKPEAEALVEFVVRCCSEERYKEKTMGVISLLGGAQARYIQDLLIQQIGPEEIQERRLHCGDAYAFQGDERDVILLSMVSAPNASIGTLSGRSYEQRFNVAASRAKEQMVLFHTAALADLSPSCLRRMLLAYCLNPQVVLEAAPSLELQQLRLASERSGARGAPPHPFESWFEVEVFCRIAERGYRVLPQHPVAGYRIDLLVEGMQGRMAVECDGDEWHGPERYESDMARQRQLERAGYPFWRVRGSVFYRDPDQAMADLWECLDQHHICAVADAEAVGSSHSLADAGHEQTQLPTAELNLVTVTAEADAPETAGQEPTPQSITTPAPGGRVAAASGSHKAPPAIRREFYMHWDARLLPDPRDSEIKLVAEGLTEIVRQEGPIVADRLYRLYARAAEIQKTGRHVGAGLAKALRYAQRSNMLAVAEIAPRGTEINQTVVRIQGAERIRMRSRGDRALEEIPLDEVAVVMQVLARNRTDLDEPETEALLRSTLDHYELTRMTTSVRAYLLAARSLIEREYRLVP
ncbi:MAG: DUF559 domain-containing protein, partial [Armatimonadetes bacterium]|nr:DUF559 domain-containing protein [Armatimonadota bacterium]